ncbi:MAG: cimH [Anaerospora sp.]|jgi:malate:Na+ symporter|nr:cimH [Anaerospora sp.]
MNSVNTQEQSGQSQNIFTRMINLKIGVIPLPLYLVLASIVYGASIYNKLPADMIGGFAVIMIMGIFLGDVGQKVPVLKDIGGPAILAIFVPSIMVFYQVINPAAMKSITALMKGSNFLYLYISCLVAGSILGMNRKVLIQGFLRMFIPLTVGTIAAVSAGLFVGSLFGYSMHRTFFYIIIPIVGGGIGEGILPLSLAYADILQQPQESFIPQLIPAAMLGNIVAIMSAGFLKRLAEKRPDLSGNGLLVKTGEEKELLAAQAIEKPIEFPLMGAGLLIACGFFIFGNLANHFIAIPGAIIMIFTAAIVKYIQVMPEKMEQGAYHMYRFISASLTWPLLVGLGVLYTPWKDVVAAVTPAYIAICTATVLAMITSGYFVGRMMNMYPIEAAIVTGCHSGLGGTGDVAILSAANRMELMPFAQISTRIGGACMVVMATLLLKIWH